ncbi:MAG: hypothetical protein K9K32_00605 [Halanaerobiales bacterium]|nr:hypothetical protein [Halanaerobiales bacterium]
MNLKRVYCKKILILDTPIRFEVDYNWMNLQEQNFYHMKVIKINIVDRLGQRFSHNQIKQFI